MPVPIVVPASSTGTGPTLAVIRNRLADELGFRISTTVTDTGDNSDNARVVIADELRDDEQGYDNIPPWIYASSGAQAGTQRRILSQPGVGYQGPYGAVVTSRPFAAALAAGVTIEVTGPLPIKRHLGILGLNECINQALALIWVKARVSLAGEGDYQYDLADYPWLQIPDLQAREIADTQWQTTLPPTRSPYTPVVTVNNVSRTLETEIGYASGETFYLDAVVRADYLVFDGSSWGYSITSPGLLGDAYQTAAPEQWVHTFAMMKCLQQVRKMLQARPNPDPKLHAYNVAEVQERINTWARASYKIIREQFPKPAQERTAGLVSPPVVAEWT